MGESKIEVYRQRYETFRHLDKLRWQMLQLLVALGTATALILRSTTGPLEWWFYLLLGGALVLIAAVMHLISAGIRRNGEVLQKVGKDIGDTEIPDVSVPMKSISHWMMLCVGLSGLGLIVWGIKIVAYGVMHD